MAARQKRPTEETLRNIGFPTAGAISPGSPRGRQHAVRVTLHNKPCINRLSNRNFC